MKLLRLLLAALVAGAGLVVLAQLPAAACSCLEADTAQHVRWADVVLVGTVTDVEQTEPGGDGLQSSADPVEYTFEVEQVLKGDPGPGEPVVESARDSASCGLTGVRLGSSYVVFATQTEDGGLGADSCGGTARTTPALLAAVGAALDGSGGPAGPTGDPAPPQPPVPEEVPSGLGRVEPDNVLPGWAWFAGGVLLALLGGGLAVRLRRLP